MGDVAARAATPIEKRHGPRTLAAVGGARAVGLGYAAKPRVLWVGGDASDPHQLRAGLQKEHLHVFGPLPPSRVLAVVRRTQSFDAAIIDVDAGDAAYDTVLQLSEAAEPCRSVVVGSQIDEASVREAFLVGVVACLRKPVETHVLGAAVRQAIDGTVVMRGCIHAADAESGQVPALVTTAVDLSSLTRREQEILDLLLEGRSTRKMAEHLSVTERTIKFHVSNLLRKLGASSRISLLAKLRRQRAL